MSRFTVTPSFSRHSIFRTLALGAGALAIGLALVACGDSSDDGGDTDSDSPASTRVPVNATATQSSAAAGTCVGPAGSKITAIPRDNVRKFSAYPEMVIDPAKKYTALIKTNRGEISLDLAAAESPLAVNNLVFLSCHGFYDGLTWHRVVDNFVIQGGDPAGNGTGGPGYMFGYETTLKHGEAGALAMAHSAQPASNGSQFYITTAANSSTQNLDGGYTVFGRVTAGLDVVKAIKQGDKIDSISITEQ